MSVYLEKGALNTALILQVAKDHYKNSLPGLFIGVVLAWYLFRHSILHRQNLAVKFLKILMAGLFVAIFTTLYYFIKISFFQEGSQWPTLEQWPGLLIALSRAILQGLIYSCGAAFVASFIFTYLLRKTTNS